MTDLYLTRHGETTWHAANRYAGSTDVALSEHGRAQAHGLGAWSGAAGVDAIYCSPLTRARETARPSAATTGLRVSIDDRLRELDFGQGEGLTATEMQAAFPGEYEQFVSDPGEHPLPGGESPTACVARFIDALDDTCRQHADGRVLVVAHNTAIRLALCHVLGVPLGRYRTLFPRLDNCSLTLLHRSSPRRFALLTYNSPPVPSTGPQPKRGS